MPRKIGPTIGIDGEKEYRASIQQIIQQAKTLDAEMKQVASAFGKDADEKKKNAAVGKQLESSIANQKNLVSQLAAMVERSAAATGENSRETLQWKEALANAQAELNNMESALDGANEKTSTFGDTLMAVLSADAIKAGVQAIVDGFVEIGKAAVEMGKEVVSAYADFEQLEGGVKKLFGDDAAQIVAQNAENAFKTAGLSANEYMETVTSFSAALIKSLGNDTEAAAKLADVAIRDMSDNANTFGTDMETIQNAYANFAKGQFNMLDSLSLGYAGSKAGMEQLLADAEALSGVHYDIDSYADIVEAIHVIQTDMKIAGATANEASGTISGSLDSLSGAFKNFVTGIGREGADIDQLVGNIVEAFENVVANVVPVVERLISALPKIVDSALPAVKRLLPQLVQLASDLFNEVVNTVLSLLPELIPVALEAVQTIGAGLLENLPLLISAAIQLMVGLASGLASGIPMLIEQIPVIVQTLVGGLLENLPLLIDAAIQLALGLATGMMQALPQIIEMIPTIIAQLVTALIEALPQLIEGGIQLIVALNTGLIEALPQLIEMAPQIIAAIGDALIASAPQLLEAGKSLLSTLAAGLTELGSTFLSVGTTIINNIKSSFTSGIAAAKSWGADLIINFNNGIMEYAGQVWENIKNVASGIWELLHFSEPEKGPLADFNSWAPDMMKQYASGIKSNVYRVQDAAEAAATGVENGLSAAGEGATSNAYNYGGISLVVNQQPGQSTEALVDEIMFRIQTAVDNRKAVFAS